MVLTAAEHTLLLLGARIDILLDRREGGYTILSSLRYYMAACYAIAAVALRVMILC